jgi:hypothetical protein
MLKDSKKPNKAREVRLAFNNAEVAYRKSRRFPAAAAAASHA